MGYKGNLIRNYIKKEKFFDIKIDLVNTGISSNIGTRIKKISNKIQSENLLVLNGDAIFDFNLDKIFMKHIKDNVGVTFLNAESTYHFGTVCVQNNRVVNFERNIVFESVNVKNKKNMKALKIKEVLDLQVIFKAYFKFYEKLYFEKKLYPMLIKKYTSRLVKMNGFFHSIDNVKDIILANKKKIKKNFK